jgi:hypothetical protein
VEATFLQARWLKGDKGWDLRILLDGDAWLHPWALRSRKCGDAPTEGA